MRINRQFNKQAKVQKLTVLHEKQYNRYLKTREEYKDKSIDELVDVLKNKKMSKTDTYAVTHTLMKLREGEPVLDEPDVNIPYVRLEDDNTNNDNTLLGENTNIQEEKS